ncbi:hypothetical protein Tco_0130445 [Tanacetum coccineum]
MAPVTPPPVPAMPPPSTYEVGGPSTVAAEGHSLALLEPRAHVPPSVMASHMVQTVSRLEQVGTQMEQDQQATAQREEVISGFSQQVKTLQAAVQDKDALIHQLQTQLARMKSL